jgi:hypothetical protein
VSAVYGRQRLVDAFPETDWVTFDEIAVKLPSLPRTTVRSWLDELIAAGIVTELERIHVDRSQLRNNEQLHTMLLLTDVEPTIEQIAELTELQFWDTLAWAVAEVYAASDNPVLCYPRPEWVQAWPRQSIT